MDQPVHSDEAPPGWRRACAAPLRQAFPLGATWDGLGVNFALFSAHATKVELCLFDDAGETRSSESNFPNTPTKSGTVDALSSCSQAHPARDRRLQVSHPTWARLSRTTQICNKMHRYDFAVPGSAILRCCLASISFGVTLATVVWILFFSPVTISESPRSIASKPALATS
ncbi:hypothetical protein ABIC10_008532 [Bradyrhizobium sp. S3.2.12]